MNIALVSYSFRKKFASPQQFIKQRYSLALLAEQLAKQDNLKVIVYQRYHEDYNECINGVHYNLVKDSLNTRLKYFQIPFTFHKKIKKGNHQIIHANGMKYYFQFYFLKRLLPDAKFIFQNHAEPPGKFLSLLKKWCFFGFKDYIFTAPGQEKHWKKILPNDARIHFIMESAPPDYFQRQDPAYSRKITGLEGAPVFIWVGNLTQNKDPLTVLKSFSVISKKYPLAKLYFIYNKRLLIDKMKELIDKEDLHSNVELLGYIKHKKMPYYLSASDYFVLGSHKEGSSFAVLEALSCGVFPVVTDIPSFRVLTDDGNQGKLWEAGNPDSLTVTLERLLKRENQYDPEKIMDFFEERFSWKQISRETVEAYNSL